MSAAAALGEAILGRIARALALDGDPFAGVRADGYLVMKLIGYHPQASDDVVRRGVAPHADFSWLTLTSQDSPGLEVRSRSGEWTFIEPRPGVLWVHAGELLQFAIRGRYVVAPPPRRQLLERSHARFDTHAIGPDGRPVGCTAWYGRYVPWFREPTRFGFPSPEVIAYDGIETLLFRRRGGVPRFARRSPKTAPAVLGEYPRPATYIDTETRNPMQSGNGRRGALGAWLVIAASLGLTACPNPNTYGTPRTTPRGKVSHTVAPEAFGFRTPVTTTAADGTEESEDVSATVPTFPSYQLRYGLSDDIDLGAHLYNLASLGADVKWNPLRSSIFDMAIAPGFQFYRITVNDESVNVAYLNAPLLLGLNLAEPISVVLVPGVTYAIVSGSTGDADDREAASTSDGVFGRLGFGVDFRVSENFAIHPEITFMKSLGVESDTLLYLAGLGFNFGKLPSFADVGGEEPPAERRREK